MYAIISWLWLFYKISIGMKCLLKCYTIAYYWSNFRQHNAGYGQVKLWNYPFSQNARQSEGPLDRRPVSQKTR